MSAPPASRQWTDAENAAIDRIVAGIPDPPDENIRRLAALLNTEGPQSHRTTVAPGQ